MQAMMVPGGSSPRLRGTVDQFGSEFIQHRFIPAPAGNRPGRTHRQETGTVHPRACGEQTDVSTLDRGSDGSSPRLRGTADRSDDTVLTFRFIPAPAGNSTSTRFPTKGEPVHPRACGEQVATRDGVSRIIGSSPRLRGTDHGLHDFLDIERFIPAPAGNSRRPGREHRTVSVHPRACGEQTLRDGNNHVGIGSSPRLRGTGNTERRDQTGQRFIPAPAGNSLEWRRRRGMITVHPRACGEQTWASTVEAIIPGSSPRLRGTDHSDRTGIRYQRFIPAPAGNSPQPTDSAGRLTVHPRACGEQPDKHQVRFASIGSSPRLRGTVTHRHRCHHLYRFIPAPAGNSTRNTGKPTEGPVHPRACGEQNDNAKHINSANGSSPRLRGTATVWR